MNLPQNHKLSPKKVTFCRLERCELWKNLILIIQISEQDGSSS